MTPDPFPAPSLFPFDETALRELVLRWREDPAGIYKTWFLWPERIKNFRSLRRGIEQVSAEIEAGTVGTAFRGSSLETVVHGVAEQRQIFKGADHAFLWKPKLRISDIYEDRENQLASAGCWRRAGGAITVGSAVVCPAETQGSGAGRR